MNVNQFTGVRAELHNTIESDSSFAFNFTTTYTDNSYRLFEDILQFCNQQGAVKGIETIWPGGVIDYKLKMED